MLRLAEKAFYPARVPVPRDARRHRSQLRRGARASRPSRRELGARPHRRQRPGGDRQRLGPRAAGRDPQPHPDPGAAGCTRARTASRAIFGGARRDEDKARAKERIFSLPRRVRAVGSQEPAPGALGSVQRPHPRGARASASSRCRTGPSSTSGSTSRRSTSSCPRSTSPTTARSSSGTACSSASTRSAAPAGRTARAAGCGTGRSATPRCTAPCASDADTIDKVIAEVRVDAGHRARRDPRRRQFSRGSHGRPQAGRLLLMDISEVRHGGFRGRRQEHADRPAAVRHQVGLRGPDRGRRARQPRPRRRLRRPGAADRRPARRARAGHHHRRRLPVLRHPARKFIIADTPGHIQYTRNMVTGASTADLALVLVDARKGILEQTRRHAFLATLLGVPHLVLCVNKMDLVDYDRGRVRGASTTSSGRSRPSWCPRPDRSSRSRRSTATTSSPVRQHALVRGAGLLHHLENVHIAQRPQPHRRPLPGAVRDPAAVGATGTTTAATRVRWPVAC